MKPISALFIAALSVALSSGIHAQINSVVNSLSLNLTYVGAFYENSPDDATTDIDLYVSGTFEGQSSSSSAAFSTGTRSHTFDVNATNHDFESEDYYMDPGIGSHTLAYNLTTSAMAGPGEIDSGRLFLETAIYGTINTDYDTYGSVTLVFNYDWTWDSNITEHPNPAGVTDSSLLLGYEAIGDNGSSSKDPNYAVIPGIGDLDDTIHIGIGGSLVDGTPQNLNDSGSGEIQLTFSGDSELELTFYTELESYAAMDLTLIPEASVAWFSVCIGLLPLLRRRR